MRRAMELVVAGLVLGCGTPDEGRGSGEVSVTLPTASAGTGSGEMGSSGGSGAGDASASGSGSDGLDGDTTSGIKLDVGTGETGGPMTYPVRMIPGLVSITFYERTGGMAPDGFTFLVDGPELTTRLPDPLSVGSFDIDGATGELYDVYYSDQDGTFELDGRYLTISGVFGQPLPAGGGLNLAEIGLNFEGDVTEFGNYVASYMVLGDNAVLPDGNADNSIDGDLQTHTTMGNTVGSEERLRVTLGFLSSSGPPPG